MSYVTRRSPFAVAVAVAFSLATSAQERGRIEEDPKFPVQDVTLRPLPELFKVGKGAVFHGSVDSQGAGFRLTGLQILQPVAVVALAADSTQPIRLELSKESWKTLDRRAETGKAGYAAEFFRVQDWANIRVFSPGDPRRYHLVIWVGDERMDYPDVPTSLVFGGLRDGQRVSQPPRDPNAAASARTTSTPAASADPVVKPSVAPAATSSGYGPVLWIIAGLLAVLVMLGAALVFRRSS